MLRLGRNPAAREGALIEFGLLHEKQTECFQTQIAQRSPPAPRFCPPIRRRANGLPSPGNAHSDQPRQRQHQRRKLDDTRFGYGLVVAQFLQEVAANSVSEQR
jgi:hypothetical protein